VYNQRTSPRREYRQQESQRVEDSATLAETFRNLKALTVNLAYFTQGSFTRNSEMKYRFRFGCPNDQCVGGDFDLSAELAKAVAARQATLTGELICQGWRSQTTIGQVRCHRLLRYKFSAEYVQAGTDECS
jgi:hypothetical protein